jgi:ribosomal protein L11 methyltransferase
MSWRVTLNCTRAEAEALPEADDLFAFSDQPPVIVADEPDPAKPDDWRIHAYFAEQPTTQELVLLRRLAKDGEPEVEHLEDTTDWVVKSQSGLEPIRAGRFFVHTPMHYADRPEGAVSFEIDAGLAFGTGQHDTTAGCLAALALWPQAKCIATDVDPVAIDVARENAAINRVPLGHGRGALLLAVADGMDSPMLAARAPYDLLIANILAGPLIELAPDFAKALAPGGTVILAGLLDTQADPVAAAYEKLGLTLADRGFGEWPVLVVSS